MKLVRAELPVERVKTIVHQTLEDFLRSGEQTMRVDPEKSDGNYNWSRRFTATACANKMPVKVVTAGGSLYLVRIEEKKVC